MKKQVVYENTKIFTFQEKMDSSFMISHGYFCSSEHVTPSLRRKHPQHPILSYLGLNATWKMKEEAWTVICASGLLACQTLEYMREIIEMVVN